MNVFHLVQLSVQQFDEKLSCRILNPSNSIVEGGFHFWSYILLRTDRMGYLYSSPVKTKLATYIGKDNKNSIPEVGAGFNCKLFV